MSRKGKKFVRGIRGKTVDNIEVFSVNEPPVVVVHFTDSSAFELDISSHVTLKPSLTSWAGGDIEQVKEWPEMAA